MTTKASSANAAVMVHGLDKPDWRVERLTSLMGDDWLAGEWDPGRQLVLPAPGGRLTHVLRCLVANCPSDVHGSDPLCVRHRQEFAGSTIRDLDSWLSSGAVSSFERRHCVVRACVVTGPDGRGCPRPAQGPFKLCSPHDRAWARRRAKGGTFEEFLQRVKPVSDLGPCAAASCYLNMTHLQTGLCETHFQIWRAAGRPAGAALTEFTATVRQPASSRVLSLRGLPELARLELLYSIGCRADDQVSVVTGGMRPFVDQLRALHVASLTEFDLRALNNVGDSHHVRFARYCADRVMLAYSDPDQERVQDVWDLRLFGRPGRRHLDFTAIRQPWLREAAKGWVAATIGRVSDSVLSHRLGSVGVLSAVLASGPGGGEDPAVLGRADVERFLSRVRSPAFTNAGRPFGARSKATVVEECALMLREARELGLLANLGSTFTFRRGDRGPRVPEEPRGRAIPAHVIAQLDANLDVLAAVPGAVGAARVPTLGALGEHAGEVAVLVYRLLKGTGRRVGEVTTLRLDCLDVDEHGKDVLVYDNHKAGRMGRRLPIADSELVSAVRAQQAWVRARFPLTPAGQSWLLPRPHKNSNGTNPFSGGLVNAWMRCWIERIEQIDAGPLDDNGEPVPFDRRAIHPHALRHTYAQTMADSGVAPSVLRDLMDHRSMTTTLGYYNVGEARKRAAMELVARHTIDNRGVTRPLVGDLSAPAHLREHLSWVAVPMGKCSEPTNVRAGGQACPIRYQCAACPHFETDPSYLPDLSAYAATLRKEREAMLAAGAAEWAVKHVVRQIETIASHVRAHEQQLKGLDHKERIAIEEASVTLRKARQSVPVAFGRRRSGHG